MLRSHDDPHFPKGEGFTLPLTPSLEHPTSILRRRRSILRRARGPFWPQKCEKVGTLKSMLPCAREPPWALLGSTFLLKKLRGRGSKFDRGGVFMIFSELPLFFLKFHDFFWNFMISVWNFMIFLWNFMILLEISCFLSEISWFFWIFMIFSKNLMIFLKFHDFCKHFATCWKQIKGSAGSAKRLQNNNIIKI